MRWSATKIDAFSPSETERVAACLARLMPHLRVDDVAITGGVAIQFGMVDLGREGSRDTIKDLDLVAGSVDAVAPGVAEVFLVSHYHVVQPGVPKFMVQLADPATRIRVDIFPDLVGSLARAKLANIGTQSAKMLALEDIFEHKLLTLSNASPTNPVDPKHARDARALGTLLDRVVPAVPDDSLVEDVYGTSDGFCRRCELSKSPHFPLAPKDRIFSLLGWTQPPAATELAR
jgi:hypothetical protein